MIRVRGVTVYYGSFKALNTVDVEVEAGEVLALIGPNGSGKTTLLKTMCGILNPKLGAVYLDGKEVHRIPKMELSKIIGYAPQRLEVNFAMPVLDFVLTGRRAYASWDYSREDYNISLKALKMLRADHLITRRLDQLSGGELQRVVIARALASEPKVLLLDEPTSSLDPKHQIEILETLRSLSRNFSTTVIMSLHDLTHAYRYADKTLILKDGQVFAAGRTSDVIREDILEPVYGVKLKVLKEFRAVLPEDPHVL
ncbi:MAG: ABC transporter ATP-binding protein [Infirmifilum sp.]|jgi:iron complex transport system ATP-binding protein|uniref:ABC transporter ATP-binding protein n=1 Tax=Infirmifilum TaxID=2856573 RepID=UPI00235552C0